MFVKISGYVKYNFSIIKELQNISTITLSHKGIKVLISNLISVGQEVEESTVNFHLSNF